MPITLPLNAHDQLVGVFTASGLRRSWTLPSIRTLHHSSSFRNSIPAQREDVNNLFLNVVDWTSNVFRFHHPIDHRCSGRLHKNNWYRPLQEPFCCGNRTVKFSWSYSGTTPWTGESIQGISRWQWEINRLPPFSSEGHSGILGDTRRTGRPGMSHIPSDNPFLLMTCSGPVSTSKSSVRWDRYSPCRTSLQ